jgi:hypothetical protein
VCTLVRIGNRVLFSRLRLCQPAEPILRVYISQEQGGPVIPLATWYPCCPHLRLTGYGGAVLTCLHKASLEKSSYLTIDGQSASLSWYQATIWDTRPIFLPLHLNHLKILVFLVGGALSDERMGV